MKLTVNKVYEALRHLSKNTQTGHKPPLLQAKGDTAIQVYYLKNEIQDSFKALLDRGDDLLNERQELIQAKRQTEDKKKIKELDKKIKEVNDQLNELGKQEEELTLSQGKLKIEDIKDIVDADTLQALDFAIDFNSKPKDNQSQ